MLFITGADSDNAIIKINSFKSLRDFLSACLAQAGSRSPINPGSKIEIASSFHSPQ
jgi:hypothetical protein